MRDILTYFDRSGTESGNDADKETSASEGDMASTFSDDCDMHVDGKSNGSKYSPMAEDSHHASIFEYDMSDADTGVTPSEVNSE